MADREQTGVGLQAFRDAFAAVPMPVAIVTAAYDGVAHGTTVSSFCSLSARPPLMAIALDRGSRTLAVVLATGRFGVNILAAGDEELARVCATKAPGKLDGTAWHTSLGLPHLDAAAVWLACSLHERSSAGDHVLLVGLVVDASVEPATPLLYHQRRFATPVAP